MTYRPSATRATVTTTLYYVYGIPSASTRPPIPVVLPPCHVTGPNPYRPVWAHVSLVALHLRSTLSHHINHIPQEGAKMQISEASRKSSVNYYLQSSRRSSFLGGLFPCLPILDQGITSVSVSYHFPQFETVGRSLVFSRHSQSRLPCPLYPPLYGNFRR